MAGAITELDELIRTVVPAGWQSAVEHGDIETVEALATGPAGDEVTRRIAADGWLTPDWPVQYGGRGLDPDATNLVRARLRRWRIGNVLSAIGTAWVGPTILQLGSDAAKQQLLPAIAANQDLWCQLFSEPGAGSDLASVSTRGELREDGWHIDGVKLWTSRADRAAWGLALVRTDPQLPKHAGLTCFCINMRDRGVNVSPIKQMTGDHEFFEVRLDDVVVADELRIGDVGAGWSTVRTVLGFERVAGSGVGAAPPGSVVGRSIDDLLARAAGRLDAVRADQVTEVYIADRLVELNNRRAALARAVGRPAPGGGSPYNKILQAEHTKRLQQAFIELDGLDALAYPRGDTWAAPNAWAFLRVQAKTIAGGTSEVLRNQVAERGLGLPREADPSRHRPWREVSSQ